MILIPFSTDAPVYHFPWATIGLIAANVLTLVATMGMLPTAAEYETWGHLCLQFDVINPLQWLTTNFMHDGVIHCGLNMFFLWGFGLIVEGKLGWLRFLPLYLLMGMAYGALVQVTMYLLSSEANCALGASGVIFGVMGIAAIWAPKNDMNCFLWMGVFSRILSITVLNFGLIYLALQIVFFCLQGFAMSSEALHLTGLAVGLPIGIALLKLDLVDCEGWDFFTLTFASDKVRKHRQTRRRRERQGQKVAESRKQVEDQTNRLKRSLVDAIQSKNDKVAIALYEKFPDVFANGQCLSDDMHLALAAMLQRQKKWEASIPLAVRLLKKHPPEKTIKLRLNLAQVLVQHMGQPRQAAAVLRKIPVNRLNNQQRSAYNQLVLSIRKLQSEGSVELDVHDW